MEIEVNIMRVESNGPGIKLILKLRAETGLGTPSLSITEHEAELILDAYTVGVMFRKLPWNGLGGFVNGVRD
jgi:hypothetical protein